MLALREAAAPGDGGRAFAAAPGDAGLALDAGVNFPAAPEDGERSLPAPASPGDGERDFPPT